MGFHALDIVVIVAIGLLIFGPKTLQSLSHSAGRGVGKAKEMKDKLMAELPVEEFSKVSETLSQIPTSPQQVAQKLVISALKVDDKKNAKSDEKQSASEQLEEPTIADAQ